MHSIILILHYVFITRLYHSLIKCLLIHFVSVSLVLSSPFPWGIHVLFQLMFIHIVGHSKAQAVSHQTLWGPCLIPGRTMWDLVFTKWHWDRFFFMNSNSLTHIILTSLLHTYVVCPQTQYNKANNANPCVRC